MERFIRSVYRKTRQKPVYTFITFTGFTLGITASLLIYLWIYNELGYEKFHPDYQRIYRVLTLSRQGDEILKSPGCYRPVAATMKMDYPQIENATYISYDSEDSPLMKETGGEKIESRGCWTNEDFFRVFGGFRFLEGNPDDAFKNTNSIVLSESTSKKLFGKEQALGKTLISDKFSKEVYSVGGVVRIPEQSHIDFGFMLSDKNSRFSAYSNNWSDKGFVRVYIKLAKDAQVNDKFLSDITNHISRYSDIRDKLMFQPISDIHLFSDYHADIFDKNPGSARYVWIFFCLAFLIILMSTMNYSALSVASASERYIEIGIRKTAGSTRAWIFRQFMLEAMIQTIAAAVVAVFLVWLILPWFNTLTAKQLLLELKPGLVFNLLLLTLSTGFMAGIYPSIYLSSFNPVVIFRKGSVSGSQNNLIRTLVTIQFAIAIFFISGSIVFIRQLKFIQQKDLGFDSKNIVVIPTGLWYGNKQFKEELLRDPRIISVSASVSAPVDFSYRQSIPLNLQGRFDTLQATLFWADEDFCKTYNLKITKGEFLKMNNSQYWEELKKENMSDNAGTSQRVTIPAVINETAERMIGLPDPVGLRFGDNVIVGVVKDFNFRTLQNPIGPMIITNNPETIQTMNIKIAPGDVKGTLDYIKQVFRKYRDNREFSYSFLEDLINARYTPEKRLRNITIGFAGLALMISILGILGMALFSTEKRTKEIGIRKASGAREFEIMILLNREFIKWVIAGFLIAFPAAWLTMSSWLQNFAFRTRPGWWIFILSGAIALAFALLTITWQSWKAATRNPVEALRYE